MQTDEKSATPSKFKNTNTSTKVSGERGMVRVDCGLVRVRVGRSGKGWDKGRGRRTCGLSEFIISKLVDLKYASRKILNT